MAVAQFASDGTEQAGAGEWCLPGAARYGCFIWTVVPTSALHVLSVREPMRARLQRRFRGFHAGCTALEQVGPLITLFLHCTIRRSCDPPGRWQIRFIPDVVFP